MKTKDILNSDQQIDSSNKSVHPLVTDWSERPGGHPLLPDGVRAAHRLPDVPRVAQPYRPEQLGPRHLQDGPGDSQPGQGHR